MRILTCTALFLFCVQPCLLTGQDSRSASIAEYHQRIQVAAESDKIERQSLVSVDPIPDGYTPWWQSAMSNRLQGGTSGTTVDLETLIVRTLENSSQVKVFSDLPFIRQTAIVEAQSAFDWSAFMNTRWDDLSDPVGNVLTTGGASRFRNNQWSYAGGLRRKNAHGGYFEIAQELGFQNTNSTFFQPNNQGTARLRLNYTQPLLRGRGKVYNPVSLCWQTSTPKSRTTNSHASFNPTCWKSREPIGRCTLNEWHLCKSNSCFCEQKKSTMA